MYDTLSASSLPAVAPAEVTTQLSRALVLLPDLAPQAAGALAEAGAKPGRGRPMQLTEPHLWLGLLWAVLEGLGG